MKADQIYCVGCLAYIKQSYRRCLLGHRVIKKKRYYNDSHGPKDNCEKPITKKEFILSLINNTNL